jgi:plastocyanin
MIRIKLMRPARLLVLAGLLVAPAAGEAAEPTVHSVRIHQFTFEPAELEVRVGDAVIWVNEDLAPHTATGSDPQWDTGPLGLGELQHVAFPDTGTFAYRCLYHPQMRGTIAVSGPRAERRPSQPLSAAAAP